MAESSIILKSLEKSSKIQGSRASKKYYALHHFGILQTYQDHFYVPQPLPGRATSNQIISVKSCES
uniref:Uncharacterized protein n=1 Tax=Glossina austeni TaxID=7395 RepID=A0A1A9VD84_GLOAU